VKRALHVRSWGMIVALPLLVVLQALAPTPVGMMILIIVAGLLLTSLVWVLNLGATLRVARTTRRDWAHTGEMLEEKFTIGNSMWLPVPWVEISSADDLPGYALRRAMAVPARGVMRWNTRVPCTRRGIYTLGPTLLRAGDPFGILEITLMPEDARTFYVYPPVTTAPLLADPPARLYGPRRSQPRNLAQALDISGIRAYAPGDPFNHIHWRATAHHSTSGQSEIMIKEFEPEALADVWIVLDLDAVVHRGVDEASTEEYAVRLAASLSYQMLKDQRPVGMIAYGAQPFMLKPSRDIGQLEQILRALAGMHAEGAASLTEVLDQYVAHMRRGSHCLVLTPSRDVRWIDALPNLLSRSIPVTAFLLDTQPFIDPSQEEQAMDGEVGLEYIANRLDVLSVGSQIVDATVYARLNPLRSQAPIAPVEAGAEPVATAPWVASSVIGRPGS
jgi:uncharacterized protein (DUF58 family)